MAVISFSCPSCGAPIENLKNGHSYHCSYCEGNFTFEEVEAYASKQQDTMQEEIKEQHEREVASESYQEDVISYECKQCGAQIVSDKNTVATFCLYCHSPNVIPSRLVKSYAPDKIVPFKISEKRAKEELRKWCTSIDFLPDGFTEDQHLERISPLYAPFWLYTLKGNFHLEGKGVRQKTWSSGNYRYTQRDYYEVKKVGKIGYPRIPVDASIGLDNKTMELLEPYNFNEIEDFNMAHLIGHYAEKFDDSKETLTESVKEEAKQHLHTQMSVMKSGFHSFQDTINDKDLKEDGIEYAFIPVWFLNYKYQNEDYTFTMNGQTGKVVGKLPIDKNKQKQYVIKTASILFVVLTIINIAMAVV